eukprot:jgi/Galph1/5054/GphlegSOOS_G3712.1
MSSACQAVFFPGPQDTPYTAYLLQCLHENWNKRQANGGIDPLKLKACENAPSDKENQAPEPSAEIKSRTIRKENVFEEELTEEEMSIIAIRVAEQQKRYEEFEKRENARKVEKLQSLFPYLTEEECLEAVDFCNEERKYDERIVNTPEDEAACKFATEGFWHTIRKRIAKKHEHKRTMMSDETKIQVFSEGSGMKRQRKTLKCTHVNLNGIRIGRKADGRLRLDDALKRVKESGSMDGWSEARIKAYQSIDTNPNAYYYRFNAPGEEQNHGQWTEKEEKLFFERLKECKIGENYEWGIFSMGIPGRVGYQCSNFYRRLLKEGRIKDENYYFDAKGEPKFKFKNSGKVQLEEENLAPNPNKIKRRRQQSKGVRGKKKKKKRSSWEDSSEDENDSDPMSSEDEEYRPSSTGTRSRPQTRNMHSDGDVMSLSQTLSDNSNMVEDEVIGGYARDEDNPIPDFIDVITLAPVRRPAISPYGHVLGYSTWKRALQNEPKNTCPFTKKPLRVQDLTILTWENIGQFRDAIVH